MFKILLLVLIMLITASMMVIGASGMIQEPTTVDLVIGSIGEALCVVFLWLTCKAAYTVARGLGGLQS